jgi:predicted ATPase with chaperone activity
VWRLTTLLPAMTLAKAIETTRIPHVADLTNDCTAVITTCPCRGPHRRHNAPGDLIGREVTRSSAQGWLAW